MYSSSSLLLNQLYTFHVAQHDIMTGLAGFLEPDIVLRTQGWELFFNTLPNMPFTLSVLKPEQTKSSNDF